MRVNGVEKDLGAKPVSNNENLKNIINRQKDVLAALEAEYHLIEHSDILSENVELKAEIEKLRTEYDKIQNRVSELGDENASLKMALYEQIYSERNKIISAMTQKLDIYFKSNIEGEQNRLAAFGNGVQARIKNMTAVLHQHNVDTKDEIYVKLEEVATLVNEKVTIARANAAQAHLAFSEAEREELEALKSEPITGEQVKLAAKRNNFERFVGLNLLNAIGIFLIIIGVITAARYTYVQLPETLKGIMMFAFGMLMLGAGELMNRKKSNIFSLGITAGGIGVLYVALATSYFGLNILDKYPAIVLCILITAIAFMLSNRYNSQVIMAFASIGGYLPMFSIEEVGPMVYGGMLYFIALNLLALMVSFRKKWLVPSYIGLVLNIFGTAYICLLHFSYTATVTEKVIVILYVLFAFLIYTLIPVVSTYRTKSAFRKADVVLLAINTFFSSLIMYGVFYIFRLRDFHGALAIIFAAIYLTFGKLIEKKFADTAQNAKDLFYLTGLAFVVLIIPLQFGRAWLSLGWLAEGVALTTYGILNNEKIFKRIGRIVCGLCFTAFVVFDCTGVLYDGLFAYKYFAMTLGSVILLGAYVHKKMMVGRNISVYKYAVLINVWVYTLYIIERLRRILVGVYGYEGVYNIDYLTGAAGIICTFLIAYGLPRIKVLCDKGTKIMAMVLYVFGAFQLFGLNIVESPIQNVSPVPTGVILVGTLILIAVGLISVLAVRDLMQLIVTGKKVGVEWYPLVISGYFVMLLTQNLVVHYHLSFSSAIISIIYVLAALGWIVYGFMRRYSFIRRFGLGLAILSVIKLFLIDLSSLTQGHRIVSYFALGITLVAISFVYQYFSKRLELKMEVTADVEETN